MSGTFGTAQAGIVSERDFDGDPLGESLARGVAEIGIALPDRAQQSLLDYVELLARWNRTYNLTAIREPARMVTHHLLDCLAVLPALERLVAGPVHVLDVGSGAGVPGVPFAVARPDWRVTMLEPVQKKAAFITQAIAELRLSNARSLAQRVEDYMPDSLATVIVSRAFADLASFAAAAARHLAPGGLLVAMKGVHPDEELGELPPELSAHVVPIAVPGIAASRHLVVIERSAG